MTILILLYCILHSLPPTNTFSLFTYLIRSPSASASVASASAMGGGSPPTGRGRGRGRGRGGGRLAAWFGAD